MKTEALNMNGILRGLSILWAIGVSGLSVAQDTSGDHVRLLQLEAVENGTAQWGHWGSRPDVYSEWGTHSNRLIPVYTHGVPERRYAGKNSVYRDESKLQEIYGYLPSLTASENAVYLDQTQIYEMQMEAKRLGKKFIFLIVFDGMDRTTADAARAFTENNNRSGLQFLGKTHRHAPSEFEMVTSPAYGKATVDVDAQSVVIDRASKGGFSHELGGRHRQNAQHLEYLTARYQPLTHAYTDSASSATSMMAGIKTYNGAINVTASGENAEPIGITLQKAGFRTGIVTSVPFSHATPAASYAINVSRNDYQDLSRDMLGLSSVSRQIPSPGLDVIIGAGYGVNSEEDDRQGGNFEPGNRYFSNSDMDALRNGNRYEIVHRTAGQMGAAQLFAAADDAVKSRKKLFGFFGTKYSHLAFRTADGKFDPVEGGATSRYEAESYDNADITENPSLAEMTVAGIKVLSADRSPFWLLVEAGDVDWANHDNNIDNSIGAVLSGVEAYHKISSWVTKHRAWRDTVIIVTADHGHLLVINDFKVFHKQGD